MQGLLILLALLGLSFATGYFTRDYISRRRRERARVWKNYKEPAWLRPANNNQAPPRQAQGDLGQMLNRWEERARARRSRGEKPERAPKNGPSNHNPMSTLGNWRFRCP